MTGYELNVQKKRATNLMVCSDVWIKNNHLSHSVIQVLAKQGIIVIPCGITIYLNHLCLVIIVWKMFATLTWMRKSTRNN